MCHTRTHCHMTYAQNTALDPKAMLNTPVTRYVASSPTAASAATHPIASPFSARPA